LLYHSSHPSLNHHALPPIPQQLHWLKVSLTCSVFLSEVSTVVRYLNLHTILVLVKLWSYYVQWNPYLRFLLEAMDLNIKLRKFGIEVTDLVLLELNGKWGKPLNCGTLNRNFDL
jgi:hypothetical protein